MKALLSLKKWTKTELLICSHLNITVFGLEYFNSIKDGCTTNFSPVTSTNVGIIRQKLSDF